MKKINGGIKKKTLTPLSTKQPFTTIPQSAPSTITKLKGNVGYTYSPLLTVF